MAQQRRRRGRIPIDLTSIKSDSTCLTVGLPRDLCCDICQPQHDTNNGLAKKSSRGKKRFRDYATDYWRCHQPWLSKHANKNVTSGTCKKFCRVRSYLGIEQTVLIDYTLAYPTKRKTVSPDLDLSPSPSTPAIETDSSQQTAAPLSQTAPQPDVAAINNRPMTTSLKENPLYTYVSKSELSKLKKKAKVGTEIEMKLKGKKFHLPHLVVACLVWHWFTCQSLDWNHVKRLSL